MNKSPSFVKTLQTTSESTVRSDYWDEVTEMFDDKKYKAAVIGVIDYFREDLAKETGNLTQTKFIIPHGSIILNIEITDEKFSVVAPFLELPKEKYVGLLRQVAQINFSDLTLSTIVLENNKLVFKFKCPVELCEPWKVYDIFREICYYADDYNDEFIHKFGAKAIQEAKVVYYSPEQIDDVWDTMQGFFKEAMEYFEYFEKKRWFNFAWNTLILAILKFDYYVSPQGIQRTDIEKVIDQMQNTDATMNERINKGKVYIRKMQNYDRKAFNKDIYKSEIFIPLKYAGSFEDLRGTFYDAYRDAKYKIISSNYMGATFAIQYIFLYTFYTTHIPDDLTKVITEAMFKAAGTTWKESSKILWKAISNIMNNKAGKFSRRIYRQFVIR